MNRKIVAIALVLLVLAGALMGCGVRAPDGDPKPEPTPETSLPGEDQDAPVRPLAAPGSVGDEVFYYDVSEDFRQSLWSFTSRTSGAALAGLPHANSLYSPVSLYYALAMLEAGAGGETKADLRAFLALDEAIDSGRELRNLYTLMTGEREGSAEQIANALWVKRELLADKAKGLNQDWLNRLSNDFYASAFAVDFTHPDTARAMSRWVSEATREKIRPELEISDPNLLLVLMNTLYFKAEWIDLFDAGTVNEPFFGEPSMNLEASYLARYLRQHPAVRTDRFVSTQIPLKNGYIEFVLPAKGLTPEDLLEEPDFLAGLREEGQGVFDIDFKLPKFHYQDKLDVLDKMASLGLAETVTNDPDFSAMYEGEIAVSQINQETFIALDEKGIEAAAYTDIHMAGAAPPQEVEEIKIHLNRPFLYVISDSAGAPLFVGIIRNPGDTLVEP